jgi:8-oxo-dGTP pyrophosphatase MutT (NUDIX family)
MADSPRCVRQAGAIAVRRGQVCLVRSRSGKRWVVPKGRLEPGKTLDQVALQEAWEEAGLVGQLRREPVGRYRYRKGGKVHEVLVFLLAVTEALDDWPEARWRRRRWLRPEKAARRIRHEGLRELLAAIIPLARAAG